jgi:hypothetical protein
MRLVSAMGVHHLPAWIVEPPPTAAPSGPLSVTPPARPGRAGSLARDMRLSAVASRARRARFEPGGCVRRSRFSLDSP